MFKKYVQHKLQRLVKKYFKKHHPKLIVIVGSVGKTTTKNAIATVLSTKYRVQAERGNLNSELSVPFGILGIEYPPMDLLRSVKVWRHIFKAMQNRIHDPQGVDMIIQELGTDGPGQIPHFGKYLKPDIAVITAVAPEHMEFFPGGIEDVAKEELSVAKYSDLTIVNRDDVNESFAPYVDTSNITTYGIFGGEYRFETTDGTPLDGYTGEFYAPEFSEPLDINAHLVGDHNLKAIAAAGAVAAKLGMKAEEIAKGLNEIWPTSGRMNILQGVRGSTIIDDTYNASPDAAIEALRTLYLIDSEHRIAILGSMNELGSFSAEAHQKVGEMCDPTMLDWVITIGEDSAKYLAPVARKRGNQVMSFEGPIMAGAFANKVLRDGGVVLAKGSQNGVFAEEAVKVLLAHTEDQWRLVRQDEAWLEKKNAWIASLRDIGEDTD